MSGSHDSSDLWMHKAQAKEESVLWEVILEVTMKESVSNAVSESLTHPNTRELGNRHQTLHCLSSCTHTVTVGPMVQVHSVPKRPLDGQPVECLSCFSLTWTRASEAQEQLSLSELRDDRPTGLKNGHSLVILTQELSNFWPQIRMGRVGRRQNALSHHFNGWSVSKGWDSFFCTVYTQVLCPPASLGTNGRVSVVFPLCYACGSSCLREGMC